MDNVYVTCPRFEDEHFLIRLISIEDSKDLLKVYSDQEAVPFFNSDNCHGDDFYYTTYERVEEAVNFWLWAYEVKGFVRFSIIDQKSQQVIGTIEIFHRDSKDFFNDCGLLRLDLRSDYETKEIVAEILSLIVEPFFELFDCTMIGTKAKEIAKERRKGLEELGFQATEECLIGEDGTKYFGYYYKMK